MLEVETLYLCIIDHEENVRDMSESRGRWAGLAASNCLRVKKSFELSLGVFESEIEIPAGISGEEEERYILQYVEKVERECQPLIREIMLPDALRKISTTEAEDYLASRPIEPPSAPEEVVEAKTEESCVVM